MYFIAFPPMIAAAKQLALSPDNKVIHSKWQQTNNEVIRFLSSATEKCISVFQLIDAVGNVREILQPSSTNLINSVARLSFNPRSRSCMFNQ